jgi:hypothetical protein
MTVGLSLEAVQNQLRFCLRENAGIIYWSHEFDAFDFLLTSDRSAFRGEMRNLRHYYLDGCVTSLSAGEPIDINETALYPIEVMYRQTKPCAGYFLLRKSGEMSDVEKTPYFFVSQANRDRTLQWLTRE